MCALIRPCPIQLTWEACKNSFCCFLARPTTYLNSLLLFSYEDMNDSPKSIVLFSHNCSCIHFAFPPALITFSEWFCTPLIISTNFCNFIPFNPMSFLPYPHSKNDPIIQPSPDASESLSFKNVTLGHLILRTFVMWRSISQFPDKIFSFHLLNMWLYDIFIVTQSNDTHLSYFHTRLRILVTYDCHDASFIYYLFCIYDNKLLQA